MNIKRTVRVTVAALAGAVVLFATACNKPIQGAKTATVQAAAPQKPAASIPHNPLKEAYFGEQHLHTAYSLDAYIGGARLMPSDAYHFAKGEAVEVGGVKVQLAKPLDWAAVTDHAEYIGEMYSTMVDGAPGHDQDLLKQLRGLSSMEEREKWFLRLRGQEQSLHDAAAPALLSGPETAVNAWKAILAATQENYEPGKFTTIPAFEWSCAWKGANLHRNVFFRDMNVPERPMSYIDLNHEEDLWKWLASLENRGCMSSPSHTTPTPVRA